MNQAINRAIFTSVAIGVVCVVLLTLVQVAGKSKLPAHDRVLLLQRTNRFADRYLPSMSSKEREQIVSRSYIQIWPQKALFRLVIMLTLIMLIGVLTWPTIFFVPQFRSKRRSIIVFFVVFAGTSLFVAIRCVVKDEHSMNIAGAFVDGDTIVLSQSNLSMIRSDDQLVGVFDHELTHLFGASKYHKIARDAWLVRAYQAIFALERGGFPELSNETVGDNPMFMSMFNQGVYYAGGTFPPQNAESEFLKEALPLVTSQPINPNTMNDDGADGSLVPNVAFDYGVAGVAWYLSGGNSELALTYLDNRGQGMRPDEAQGLLQKSIDNRGFQFREKVQLYQGELFHDAELYDFQHGRIVKSK
jgi:hypothetical protein